MVGCYILDCCIVEVTKRWRVEKFVSGVCPVFIVRVVPHVFPDSLSLCATDTSSLLCRTRTRSTMLNAVLPLSLPQRTACHELRCGIYTSFQTVTSRDPQQQVAPSRYFTQDHEAASSTDALNKPAEYQSLPVARLSLKRQQWHRWLAMLQRISCGTRSNLLGSLLVEHETCETRQRILLDFMECHSHGSSSSLQLHRSWLASLLPLPASRSGSGAK